ncbi:hypothetical protein DPMN_168417 [Dreissena polymorpha]|uniref:Uncharacterized protein n=1 Tax=Dreissena polymorpha TaxID=45954 RepID=A0A9D4IVW9_DREPO|nr:hypothetical protein DPMN_168417 [Dreissena polymorpha]
MREREITMREREITMREREIAMREREITMREREIGIIFSHGNLLPLHRVFTYTPSYAQWSNMRKRYATSR